MSKEIDLFWLVLAMYVYCAAKLETTTTTKHKMWNISKCNKDKCKCKWMKRKTIPYTTAMAMTVTIATKVLMFCMQHRKKKLSATRLLLYWGVCLKRELWMIYTYKCISIISLSLCPSLSLSIQMALNVNCEHKTTTIKCN